MADTDFQEVAPKQNFKPVGRSGTYVSSYVVQDDYLQALNGINGQNIFHKMSLSDAQIRKLIHAVNNPIKSAVWDIEPASEEANDVRVADVVKHVLFDLLPDGGFEGKLDEILTFPWMGHAVFERVHKNFNTPKFGPITGYANIAFRDQRTLDKWNFSGEGILQSVHQLQQGDIPVDVDIPADVLTIFYNEKKGNDLGFPFLRMLYGNYKRKLLYKELQAIGIERGAISVPHLKVPQNVDYQSEEYADAAKQLAAFTQAEQAYFITPYGYELTMNQTNTFDPAKVQTAIKAENEEISGSLVAMWLEMGIGGNSAVGSSTGVSAEFFRAGIEYIANKIKKIVNEQWIKEICLLNFGELEVYPKLVHAGIADEVGEELMKVVTGYVKDGVIKADEPLEEYVRKAHNLPKKAMTQEGEPTPAPAPEPSPSPDDVELNDKTKNPKTPRDLMKVQAVKVSDEIRASLEFAAGKYVNDVINKYKKLGADKKQKATDSTIISGTGKLKKDLKRALAETANLALTMVRKEVPTKSNVELNNHERDIIRLTEKYGDLGEIKFNEYSSLPGFVQVLISKQSDLIAVDSITELKKRLDFTFSSIETKSNDENVIKQAMEEAADDFINSNQVTIKGDNVSALMVNESRASFFFEPDVLEEIHSFTFMNPAPVAAICKELAGVTFNTNDAESLRYSPPLHHNCKSYLRANLKTSKGVERLEVSILAPSAQAQKSITL